MRIFLYFFSIFVHNWKEVHNKTVYSNQKKLIDTNKLSTWQMIKLYAACKLVEKTKKPLLACIDWNNRMVKRVNK